MVISVGLLLIKCKKMLYLFLTKTDESHLLSHCPCTTVYIVYLFAACSVHNMFREKMCGNTACAICAYPPSILVILGKFQFILEHGGGIYSSYNLL